MSESRIADQVGKVLGGRYRLIALIGIGASGEVYLADDTQLRRQVAVKVLHRVLADDAVFLQRFRDEARMAASLSHPNIVAVHDWGEDDVPFLVTEYLSGGSLRAMLDQAGTLTLSQALLVGLEVTRGLEYAHRRGVVQRDIKPGNILFDGDGHVRIADFGLAKALAEASVTEPSGSILGTVRYASPEQAQGKRVHAKSDVYSLGLVLVEVVTGSLPFGSDTPISTLMARVDAPLQLGDEFGPLRGVVERACRAEEADRPDAGEFHVGLMAAAEELPRPEPLPLVGAVTFDPLVDVDADPTMVGVASAELADVSTGGRRGRRRSRSREADAKRAAPAATEEPRRRRWPWMVLMMLLISGAGIATYAAQTSSDLPVQAVPEARGLTPDEFRAQVGDFWQLTETSDREDDSVPGTILRTDPEAGEALEQDQVVTYWVSLGNVMRTVPTDLVGLQADQAEQFLIGAGLTLGAVTDRNDETAEPGTVVEVATRERQLPTGSMVDLVVSSGPKLRVVPDGLEGLTFAEAESQLAVERLVAVRSEAFDNEVAEGLVVSVAPVAGTEVERGAEVALVVSKGPEPVVIPQVAGNDLTTAVNTLEGAGLCIGETDGPANTPVIGTDPPAGTTVRVGTCVRIITSEALATG